MRLNDDGTEIAQGAVPNFNPAGYRTCCPETRWSGPAGRAGRSGKPRAITQQCAARSLSYGCWTMESDLDCRTVVGTSRTCPVTLVTGASGAIGAAVTAMFAGSGHRVLAVGRNAERLSAATSGETVVPVLADLREETERARVLCCLRAAGRLATIVLGSGLYARSDDPGVFDAQLQANVTAPYALLRSCLPSLIASRGQVIFLNSTQGLSAGAGVGQYAATQHALRAIADSLRDEVNGQDVRVSSIYLGRTATARQEDIFALEGRPYTPERLIQPRDVAELVACIARLPRTAEVTNLTVRPMLKS